MYSSAFGSGEDGVIRDESLCRRVSENAAQPGGRNRECPGAEYPVCRVPENAEDSAPESAEGLKRGCRGVFGNAEDLLLAAAALLLLLDGERGGDAVAFALMFLLFL